MQELCANVCVLSARVVGCEYPAYVFAFVGVFECMWVYPCKPGVRRDRLIQVVSSLLEKGDVLDEYWLTCVDCIIVRSDMS